MKTLRLTACVLAAVALAAVSGQAQTGDKAITLKLLVPADAKVEIDGTQTRSAGEVRRYVTPPLTTGWEYTYNLKVTHDGKVVTRAVSVTHGGKNTFDLRAEFQTAKAVKGSGLSKEEAVKIAEEAYIYAFPMVMNYGTLYEYFIDKSSSQYKCPFNQIYNMARVATPKEPAQPLPH
jgi:uncharacterized protein (TIGR03000 family)